MEMNSKREGPSVLDALAGLLEPPPRNSEAASELQGILQRLAGSLNRRSNLLPAHRKDDVVQSVLLKLLERGGLPPSANTDAVAAAYLKAMVQSAAVDLIRRRKNEFVGEADDVATTGAEEGDSVARGDRLLPADLRYWATDTASDPLTIFCVDRLSPVFDHLKAARQERYRPALEQAWHELLALAFTETTLEVLIFGKGGGADVDDRSRKTKQNARHKAHQRLRDDLGRTIDEWYELGSWSDRQRTEGLAALSLLLRCQSGTPGASQASRND